MFSHRHEADLSTIPGGQHSVVLIPGWSILTFGYKRLSSGSTTEIAINSYNTVNIKKLDFFGTIVHCFTFFLTTIQKFVVMAITMYRVSYTIKINLKS